MTAKYNFYFTYDEVELLYSVLCGVSDFPLVLPSVIADVDCLLIDHDFADIVCSEAKDGD